MPESKEDFLVRHLGPTGGAIASFFIEIIEIAVFVLLIVLPVRYFLVQPFVVKGASMEPSFDEDEYLIIDELSYHFRLPERGEIVVFHPPKTEEQFYIKRVIGLPGETVQIDEGKVTIFNSEYPNGNVLQESYLTEPTTGRDRVTLGPDEYYLLGDNRDASLDSRVIGPISLDRFAGRVWLRGLPLDLAGFIQEPQY